MEIIKPGTMIDFMRFRTVCVSISAILVTLSVASLFWPGPNLGIDFAGGTELQIQFLERVDAAELRGALEASGYPQSDVVSVEGSPNEYIIRVEAVSALPAEHQRAIEERVRAAAGDDQVLEFRVSPGGDKISMRFRGPHEPTAIQGWLAEAGVEVRSVNSFGSADDHRYEAHLIGVGDEIVQNLRQQLGDKAPETPLRIEWVGPRAGQQLRNAAIEALLYAVAFIMLYVAFRFDIRFAPGSIVALIHDVVITLGIYVLVQRQVTLATIAALLTIIGFSINDTIVVYDRIRENMARAKDQTLTQIINTSTSQVFSRTIITSVTTLASVMAFFVWGTPVIQDLAFALMVGIAIGTYSSVYIAAPVTEWIDRRFFNRSKSAKAA